VIFLKIFPCWISDSKPEPHHVAALAFSLQLWLDSLRLRLRNTVFQKTRKQTYRFCARPRESNWFLQKHLRKRQFSRNKTLRNFAKSELTRIFVFFSFFAKLKKLFRFNPKNVYFYGLTLLSLIFSPLILLLLFPLLTSPRQLMSWFCFINLYFLQNFCKNLADFFLDRSR
jgi:hypothetical protein